MSSSCGPLLPLPPFSRAALAQTHFLSLPCACSTSHLHMDESESAGLTCCVGTVHLCLHIARIV